MSPAEPPLVSVVIPTYNRAATLARAVESVLAQTYPSFELLIVDDASTDDTAARIAPYLGGRVALHRRPRNGGATAARNAGIALARGAYVAFLDSDDEWLPEKLARQVALFEAGPPDLGLVYAGLWQLVDGRPPVAVPPRQRGRVYDALRWRNRIGTASGVMVRRAVLQRVGGFDERLPACEDWDLWLRIARDHRVDAVAEPLLRYHDGNGDRLSNRSRAVFLSNRAIYRRHNAGGASRRIRSMHLALCARELYRVGHVRAAGRMARAALLLWPTREFAPRIALRATLRGIVGEAGFRRARPAWRAVRQALGAVPRPTAAGR
ncbi:MAG: glycosyltransferase family A protein [Dongiaceae bacterium]